MERAAHPIRGNLHSSFAHEDAMSLTREILMQAWHTARSTSSAACILFGMSMEVTAFIAELRPRHVDQLAANHSEELRYRWLEKAMFWKGLLSAAIGDDDRALKRAHVHGLQLLGGEKIGGQ